jgi:hypothetical protein
MIITWLRDLISLTLTYAFVLGWCCLIVAEMIAAGPEDCQSDSFYFVQDRLIMHNKAKYQYVEGLAMGSGGAGSAPSTPADPTVAPAKAESKTK